MFLCYLILLLTGLNPKVSVSPMSQERGIISYFLISLYLLSNNDISSRFIIANRTSFFLSSGWHFENRSVIWHACPEAAGVPAGWQKFCFIRKFPSISDDDPYIYHTYYMMWHLSELSGNHLFKEREVPAKLTYGLDLAFIQENNFMAACLHPCSPQWSLQVLKHEAFKQQGKWNFLFIHNWNLCASLEQAYIRAASKSSAREPFSLHKGTCVPRGSQEKELCFSRPLHMCSWLPISLTGCLLSLSSRDNR